MDFSDQEATFGSLLGSVPNIRAHTNGVIVYKGYVVGEWGDTTWADPTYSVAKSMLSTVAAIVDYGMTIQQALEAGRFTKGSFEGCDVQIESLVPETVRDGLKARGHDLRVVPPRSGPFGYGQAVMSVPGGVHFGASEPRHDGAAIPEGAPAFTSSSR